MLFKADVEKVDALRQRLAIEVPVEEVQREIERAYAGLGREAKVPGFRPGRVPRPVLERLFGDRVRADVFGRLIQQSYTEVIEERGIAAVGQPEIVTEQAQVGSPLRYNATVEVKPEIVVGDYAGLEVERPVTPVTEANVDAHIERLRQSLAQLLPITERSTVAAGDVVTLDYEARIEGRLAGRGEGRPVEIGASGFPPPFDEQLIGRAIGTEADVSVAYPDNAANAELAGKTVVFHVRLQALARKEVPPLDDEFAKDHGECATIAELRERARQQLQAEAERRGDELARDALLGALARAHDIPVPSAMVERRTHALIEEVVREWERRRIRPKNDTDALARLREDLAPRAREQVKLALLLEAIASQEGLRVTDEALAARINEIADSAGSARERVRALYHEDDARRQLRTRMLHAQALDHVVAKARIRTVERHVNVAEPSENG